MFHFVSLCNMLVEAPHAGRVAVSRPSHPLPRSSCEKSEVLGIAPPINSQRTSAATSTWRVISC